SFFNHFKVTDKIKILLDCHIKIQGGINKLFNKRIMKYGTNSLIMIIAVVGIVFFINLLFSNVEALKNMKLDLTPNKVYSIGDTSKAILKDVKEDVTIYGMFDESQSTVNTLDYKQYGVMELLNKYGSYSHIKVVYKDPVKYPTIAKQIDPDNLKNIQRGYVVVKCGDKIRSLSIEDLFEYEYSSDGSSINITKIKVEDAITSAIKYVTAKKTPVAYFLTGENELDADAYYTIAKDYIEKNNFDVKTLNLRSENKVPGDASLVVFLSPQADLTVSAREALRDYLKAGGNAVFMFDYLKTNPSLEQFNNLLSDYNLSLDNDIIKELDTNKSAQGNRYLFRPEVQPTAVTSSFNSNSDVTMYQARSINMLKNQKSYVTLFELLKTSDLAVGEQADKTKGVNISGPMDVAVAVESKAYTKPSRIVVFGNSQFISDDMLNSNGSGGLDFLLSSLNWMQDNKDSVDISPKVNQQSSMILTSSQSRFITWSTVVIIPVLILGIGIFVWLRRRHL
ncbi:MAG TPA: GldG family protein, partial [Clostridia bacterium]|nr:GldG family protein [Clostridia bacterium]